MSSDTGKTPKPHGPHPYRSLKPLKRGRACMSCRFLKIKCDGAKPICGPCTTHPRDDECEYADGPGRSRTKLLEDTVTRLEARVHELENPDSSTPSVVLHDPYLAYNVHRLPNPLPLPIPESSTIFSPLSSFSPTLTTSSLPSASGRHWHTFSALEANTELTGSSGSSTSPIRHPVPVWNEELSLGHIQASLDKFLPHAQQFGFFLHIPPFRSSSLLAFPVGHPSRPTPGLLSVLHLFGVHFSQPEALLGQETPLLTRAAQLVSADLFGNHPNKYIHTLQAEILLSYYCMRTGLLLESKCHAGAAVALALGSGLHKVRSSNFTVPPSIGISYDQPVVFTPPADTLQEAERINGFWAVLMLHKFMTVALEVPANVCGALEAPGMQIDTPWPIDVEKYEEGDLRADILGNSTVRAFLNGYPTENGHGESSTALLAKAAILFHRSAHLTGQWSPSLTPRDTMAYEAAAKSVGGLIDSLRTKLGRLTTTDAHNPTIRTTLLTHALVDAASIKLHWIFAYNRQESKDICIFAARNMVNYGDLNLQDIGYINPIMGNLWMVACLVLIDQISRTRQLKSTWAEASAVEEDLMESYRNGLKAMSSFSQESTLMRYQLTKVHEAFEAI